MDILTSPYGAFFLLSAIGIALGRIKIKNISLDTSAIFFIALIFGHFGITIPLIIQQIGLIFFMYSIGIQAGPGFFESFKKQGVYFLYLALILGISGSIITIVLSKVFDIDILMAVGLFSGSLTSASSLAVTIENTHSAIPSIGFGIAFPFGVIGVVLITRFAPNIFRINIAEEEKKHIAEIWSIHPKLFNKNFIAENPEIIGKSLVDINLRNLTNTTISRIYQNNLAFIPSATTIIKKGDILRASGTMEDLSKLTHIVGPETNVQIPVNRKYIVRQFLVTNNRVINKSLGQLALLQIYNATVTTIRRSGIELNPKASSRLRFGDKITVTLPEESLKKLSELLGDDRKKIDEIDLFPIVTGILIGILISLIKIKLPHGITFTLGLTGGVLIAGILLSRIGKTGKILWNVSGGSNQFMRKLGLTFFLSGVGTQAGSHIIEVIKTNGASLLLIGVAITVIPMFITLLVGKYLFKLNFLSLLGALTGSMTSTPALSAIEPLTKTNAPQIAYATVYPFALIIIIILSQIIILF
jgi:putative transport protein